MRPNTSMFYTSAVAMIRVPQHALHESKQVREIINGRNNEPHHLSLSCGFVQSIMQLKVNGTVTLHGGSDVTVLDVVLGVGTQQECLRHKRKPTQLHIITDNQTPIETQVFFLEEDFGKFGASAVATCTTMEKGQQVKQPIGSIG